MNGLEFNRLPESILNSFEKGKIINFEITIRNISKEQIAIELEHNLNPILENISKLQVNGSKCPARSWLQRRRPNQAVQLMLEPKENEKIKFQLESTAKKELSESCDMPFFIGELIVKAKETEMHELFPKIEITTTSSLWEKECCEFFEKLGLQVFPMSHSDRPDAVIDISGLQTRPNDISGYLSGNKEKMLMETTRPTYSGSKLEDDVANFENHTTLVLKIAAVGQIIVAKKFEWNIEETYNKIIANNTHRITLIDKENLEYLICKFEEFGSMGETGQSKVIQVLNSNRIVDADLINAIFAESK